MYTYILLYIHIYIVIVYLYSSLYSSMDAQGVRCIYMYEWRMYEWRLIRMWVHLYSCVYNTCVFIQEYVLVYRCGLLLVHFYCFVSCFSALFYGGISYNSVLSSIPLSCVLLCSISSYSVLIIVILQQPFLVFYSVVLPIASCFYLFALFFLFFLSSTKIGCFTSF